MQPLEQMLSVMISNRKLTSNKVNLQNEEFILTEKIRQQKLDLIHNRIEVSQADSVRPEIVASWLRSYKYGLDPNYAKPAPILDQNTFQERLREKDFLMKAADAYIGQLETMLFNTNCIVLLSDENGLILRVVFGRGENEKNQVFPGVIWNEKTIGTCSHVMCMLLESPIQMCGPEHYCEQFSPGVASSVPIFDTNHDIIGTLTIASLKSQYQNPHTFGLAVSMAWAIQNDLHISENNELLNATLEANNEAVITVNSQGFITKANMEARRIFHNQDKELLGRHFEDVFEQQMIVSSVLESGEPVLDTEIKLDKLSQTIHLHSVRAMNNYYGKTIGAVIKFKIINPARKSTTKSNDQETRFSFDDIIGSSPQIIKSVNMAKKFAPLGSNILIQGESGTGKEVYAQAIHNFSRPNGKYIAVNCAAIPKTLIESELFGYEGGAFTGAERQGKPGKIELANGGTLFLDEIGDMPLELQPVLLRVLEEKKLMRVGGSRYIPVDFRLIAATHKDLVEMVENNQFRQDLYYRLAVFKTYIPPLWERGADIIRLAKYFINKVALQQSIPPPVLSESAELQLLQYNWPGNVRQLENAMFYAVNMSNGGVIQADDLPDEIKGKVKISTIQDSKHNETLPGNSADNNLSIKEMERIAIIQLLQKGNSVCEAADILGLSKTTMYRKIKEYKIYSEPDPKI